MSPTIDDIRTAAIRIKPYIKRTPLLTSAALNEITGAKLFFKCENFQKAGAFKFRGACNAVFSLSDEAAAHGVATHSSGNHAGALALAAKTRGIPAYIVMPENSTRVKIDAVRGYGAEITFCEPTITARQQTLDKIIEKTHAVFIHPYDNYQVICGQGTCVIELLEKIPVPDIIIAPVGGGGLIAGTSIAVKALMPTVKVIGAEPLLANDAYLSFQQKELILTNNQQTICDGLLTSIGKLTFPIIIENVNDIITATEETILRATRLIWERMKIVVEPSAAIALAIVLEQSEYFRGKNIGLILSGGNVDIKNIANQFESSP